MNGRKNTKKLKKVYVDSCIYIYLFEGTTAFSEIASETFKKLNENNTTIVGSPLILSELLRTEKLKDDMEKREIIKEKFLTTPNLEIIDFSLPIADLAASISVKYKLSLADAIHLATAIIDRCEVFITNDKRIKKLKEIKVLQIDKE